MISKNAYVKLFFHVKSFVFFFSRRQNLSVTEKYEFTPKFLVMFTFTFAKISRKAKNH